MARQTRRSVDSNGVRRLVEHGSKAVPVVRCAIYTRKSTVEGLDQAFNSLDAQREAAESYIASQRHQGWKALSDRYDDGGFSGGSMDRPAVARLMADVEAGLIDCVVVYKVDRLSRSLLDFARMMQVFENKGVHFVSVTQHFNTAESMGRLTLNILLSFAQFEREIISERTRDKIAAARKRGQWVGGRPILGYDLDRANHKLVVNPKEAEQVRAIFRLYLKERTLLKTATTLNQRGWHTKSWTDSKGRKFGNQTFTKNQLSSLLGNVAYLGKVRHREQIHDGQQDAIIDQATWDQVQALLDRNHRTAGAVTRNKYGALLKGLLRCAACDAAMIHSPVSKGIKKTKQYRYYVCTNAQKRGYDQCPNPSLPADWIEKEVVERLNQSLALPTCRAGDPRTGLVEQIAEMVEAVEFNANEKQLGINLTPLGIERLRSHARNSKRKGGPDERRPASNVDDSDHRLNFEVGLMRSARRFARLGQPTRSSGNPLAQEKGISRITRTLALAHQIEGAVLDSRAPDYRTLARQMSISPPRIGQIVGLTQLAPAIQERILLDETGLLAAISPRDVERIAEFVDWREQNRRFEKLASNANSGRRIRRISS